MKLTPFRLALMLLVVALCAGAVLRVEAILPRAQMQYDEAVTYMTATGHAGAYQQAERTMTGRWEPAAAWKSFIEPGSFWDFRHIAADLSRYDNHPPLYFWLLHVWIAAFGLQLHTGPWLNLVIAALTCLSLFGLACYLLSSPLLAAIVALAWALSPGAIETTAIARQYELFGLTAVLFVWLIVRCTDPGAKLRLWLLVALALVTAAGSLTHYDFVIVLAAGGCLALFRLARRHVRRLAQNVAAVVAGLLLAWAANPLFYLAIERQRNQQVKAFSMPQFIYRLKHAIMGVLQFFVVPQKSPERFVMSLLHLESGSGSHVLRVRWLAVAILLVLIAVVVVGWARGWHRGLPARLRRLDHGSALALYFLLFIGGATVALYLDFRSPPYAMAPRYLAAVWPFMAFLPVLIARLFKRWTAAIALAICLVAVLPGGIQRVVDSPVSHPYLAGFAGAQRAVMEQTNRGDLMRVMWFTPPDLLVFVGSQDVVLRTTPAWLSQLRPGDLFIPIAGPGSPTLRAESTHEILNDFTLTPIKGRPHGATTWYRLGPKAK